MSPGGISSPIYNPNTELYKTPNPYSPVLMSEDDSAGRSIVNYQPPMSPYSPGSPPLYTPGGSGTKSPYQPAQSGNEEESPVGTYSPRVPAYVPSIPSSKYSPKYRPTTSPGYQSSYLSGHQENYSPSSAYNKNNSPDPDYSSSNFRNSNYSGGSSPRVQDSGGSGSQHYSPKSPAYNVKSPGYGNKFGIYYINLQIGSVVTQNSPFYNSNLKNYSNTNQNNEAQKKLKTGSLFVV